MNFTERLDYLLKKNNLNKHKLSVLCTIPYSTIDGWYKKGCENIRLETLRKLSNFFNVSISYWINDDVPEIIGNTQIDCEKKKESDQEVQKTNTIAILGRDGTREVKHFSDEEFAIVKKMLSALPDIDEDL